MENGSITLFVFVLFVATALCRWSFNIKLYRSLHVSYNITNGYQLKVHWHTILLIQQQKHIRFNFYFVHIRTWIQIINLWNGTTNSMDKSICIHTSSTTQGYVIQIRFFFLRLLPLLVPAHVKKCRHFPTMYTYMLLNYNTFNEFPFYFAGSNDILYRLLLALT